MRVFKPSYSKPLPEGAKVFTCKQGRDAGKQFAKFKDARGRTVQAPLTKKGDAILCEVKPWHLGFEDKHGIRRLLKAYVNERESQSLADKIQDLIEGRPADAAWVERLTPAIRNELIAFGLLDAQRAEIAKPLSEHIEEYRDHLTKKERGDGYVREVARTLENLFQACGFVTWTDISAGRLKDHLDGLRDTGKGISKRRYNALLGAVKSFARWMVKQQKAAGSPIEFLDGLDNQQTDRRHDRRVLVLNDFRRFLEAALKGPTKYGLSGYERNLLYRFAAETGLRRVDIQRLRVRDFNFKERKIAITAGRTKNRQDAVVYLRPATAAEMQQYCGNKMPNASVFHVAGKKEAKMVRFDLANTAVKDANGKEILPAIPYVENGLYFDFHSLRHQCASLLAMNPDTPEAVRQQALRHKTPEMTRHYSHAFEDQQREAVNSLPDLTQPSRESQAAAKTGTDDRDVTAEILSNSCFQGARGRDKTGADGNENRNGVEIPPSRANSEGVECISNPSVGGSNPSGRSVEVTKTQALTEPNRTDSVHSDPFLASGLFSGGEIDADLRAVIDHWSSLSVDLRREIRRIAESPEGSPNGRARGQTME